MNIQPKTSGTEQLNETIRETNQTLREIITRLAGQPIFLFGIASMLLALVALIVTSSISSVPQLGFFPYALLVFGLLLTIFAVRSQIVSSKASPAPQATPSKVFHIEPVYVAPSIPESVVPMPSSILRAVRGGISIWVYLDPFGNGIRRLVNNRYILSHDTNSGLHTEDDRYLNVFSLSRGPKSYDPPEGHYWKIWITNGEGESWSAKYRDSIDLQVGWHHFLVRWDKGKPLIELLIDGLTVIEYPDYLNCWPTEYTTNLLIGTWTSGWKDHYVDTYLWRAQGIYTFPDDNWVAAERKNTPPEILK